MSNVDEETNVADGSNQRTNFNVEYSFENNFTLNDLDASFDDLIWRETDSNTSLVAESNIFPDFVLSFRTDGSELVASKHDPEDIGWTDARVLNRGVNPQFD